MLLKEGIFTANCRCFLSASVAKHKRLLVQWMDDIKFFGDIRGSVLHIIWVLHMQSNVTEARNRPSRRSEVVHGLIELAEKH